MPRIEIYQSQVTPGVDYRPQAASADAFGAGFGDDVARAGRQIGQAAETVRARQDRAAAIEQQRAEEDAKADAAMKLAQAASGTAQLVSDARTNAQPGGAGHLDTVLKSFDEQSAATLSTITDHKAQNFAAIHFAEQRAGLIEREGAWAAAKSADKLASDFGNGVDTDANTLYASPTLAGLDEAVKRWGAVADSLSVDPDTRAKLATDAKHKLGALFLQGLSERDPYQARALIQSGKMASYLDADRTSALGNRADAEIKGREAAARQEQREREAEARRAQSEWRAEQRDLQRQAGDQARDMAQVLRDGGSVAPADVGRGIALAARSGNHALVRDLQHLGITANVNTALRGAPPVAIQGEVDKLQAKVNAAGTKADPNDLTALKAARSLLDTSRRELKADPLGWSSQQGVVTLAPLNPGDPKSYGARVAALDKTGQHYGVPVAPLTPAELDGYRAVLTSGAPPAKLQALRELGGLGKYRAAAMRQIGSVDQFSGHVGLLTGARYGAGTAADALAGVDIAKANPKLFDGRTGTELNDHVGGALARLPGLQASLPKVADALYATRRSRAGLANWQAEDYGHAVDAALGAYRDPSGTQRGGIGSYRSQKVLLPDDVSQDEFEAAIGSFTVPAKGGPVDRRGRPVDADTLRQLPLVSLGGGRYAFGNDPTGSTVVSMPSGAPFVVTIGHREPRR